VRAVYPAEFSKRFVYLLCRRDCISKYMKAVSKMVDAIIAATALTEGFTLVTRSVNDFKKILNLQLLNPFEL